MNTIKNIFHFKREAEDPMHILNAQVIFNKDDIVIAEYNFTSC